MKNILLIFFLFLTFHSYSQSISEKEILVLSDKIFQWEVAGRMDSLDRVFHEKFTVIGADGNFQHKIPYLERLKTGDFVHDSIRVEESEALVIQNTAILNGKGKFFIKVSGKSLSLRLSYMEVFIRPDSKKPWKVLAMKASLLDNK